MHFGVHVCYFYRVLSIIDTVGGDACLVQSVD